MWPGRFPFEGLGRSFALGAEGGVGGGVGNASYEVEGGIVGRIVVVCTVAFQGFEEAVCDIDDILSGNDEIGLEDILTELRRGQI